MSTETKIGLIIGLGFIVCFAVLLANTDPEQNSTVQWTHVVEGVGTSKIQPRPQSQPLRAKPATDPSTTQRSVPRPQAIPKREDGTSAPQALPVHVTGPDAFDRLVDAGQASPAVIDPPVTSAADRAARLQQYLDDARQGPQTSQAPNSESVEPRAEEKDVPRDRRKNTPVRSPARFQAPAQRNTSSLARHTVVAGDTLSKIAGRYYGSRSRKVIDAIFDTNRAVMSGPDRLSIGMELSLPRIDGISRLASSRPHEAVTSAARSTQDAARAVAKPVASKWYQIQKNDRYVSIAREQLGDGSRWKEIHELNKERFPDPGKIQWGVRIKLPALRSAMAGRP